MDSETLSAIWWALREDIESLRGEMVPRKEIEDEVRRVLDEIEEGDL